MTKIREMLKIKARQPNDFFLLMTPDYVDTTFQRIFGKLDLRWDYAKRDLPFMPKTSLRLKSLLSLAILAVAWQFSVSALGKPVITSPDVVVDSRSTPTKSRGHANAFGVDGAGCIVPENKQGQPSHDSAPFGSPCDIDVRDTDWDDLRADTSTRNDQDTPLFSVSGTDALRTPRIVPILLFPAHCFFCLHEHIRERAPPSAVASAKEDPLPI